MVREHLSWLTWLQQDLAAALGWTESKLSRRLSLQTPPSYDEINLIAEKLRITGPRYVRWRELTGYPIVPKYEVPEDELPEKIDELLMLVRETHQKPADPLFDSYNRLIVMERDRYGSGDDLLTLHADVDLGHRGILHGFEWEKLAQQVGAALGIPRERIVWDHTHYCGDPKCPDARSYADVFVPADSEISSSSADPI